MKLFIFTSLFIFSLAAPHSAFAFPNAEQMQENFKTCEANVPDWDEKWGKYVKTFDINQVHDVCNEIYPNEGTYRYAACRVDGHSLYAGFVCDDIDGGSHR